MYTLNLIVIDIDRKNQSEFIGAVRDSGQYENSLFGRIHPTDKLLIWLFGIPMTSDSQYEMLWEILAEGADGYIFVIDCTQPAAFPEAARLIQIFRQYAPVPFVVAAHGFNTTTHSLKKLIEQLNLPVNTDIMPCIVSDPNSAKAVVQRAFQKILETDEGRILDSICC